MNKYSFQNCQKIVVFSKDKSKILLAKRKGEADYNEVFSFIGGKMETSDESIVSALKREKDEEVGENFKINIYPVFCINVRFKKKDGSDMILPHYFAVHNSGDIDLNEEYSEYKWIEINKLEKFEPKIPNIYEIVAQMQRLMQIVDDKELI